MEDKDKTYYSHKQNLYKKEAIVKRKQHLFKVRDHNPVHKKNNKGKRKYCVIYQINNKLSDKIIRNRKHCIIFKQSAGL